MTKPSGREAMPPSASRSMFAAPARFPNSQTSSTRVPIDFLPPTVSLSAATINLGATRVGSAALGGSVTVSNGVTSNAYQESLVYGLGATPAALWQVQGGLARRVVW